MLALIALICFPFAIYRAWKNIKMAEASPSWPAVDGVVTAAERGRVTLRMQPRVTYSYAVKGVPFTSKRVSFAGVVPKQEIDSVLRKYPAGQAVTVHYAPENPVEAVLEPGSGPLVVAPFRSLVVLFIVFILAQALLVFLRWNETTEKTPVRTYGDMGATTPGVGDHLIRQDSEKADARAQYLTGSNYLFGNGVEKDPAEGAKWLRKSADQGHADAQAVLGELYASGTGVEKNPDEAIALFRKAAEQGNDRAYHDLGYAYETGFGVPQDSKQAIEWYRKVKSDPRTADALKRVGAATTP